MSKIKLVAMDLDNTLLNDDKKISQHTREVLEAAITKGIYIVPATGRIYKAIPDFLRQMQGVRYALCCNGATVYDAHEKKEIYTNHLPMETVFSLYDVLKNFHCTRDIYQSGQGYMEERYLRHLEDYNVQGHILKLVHETRLEVEDIVEYIKVHPMGIEKVSAFFDDMDQRSQAMEELKALQNSSVASSLANNIEITQLGCDKGDGLIHLAEHLGIPMSQVMACGDAGNDEAMIQVAGMGVVMENASKEIKNFANYITKTNNEDGVAYAIEKFVL